VLSIGQRAMGKLTDDQIGQLKRSDVESNIDFMGLIVFRNELKEDTRDAIIEMKVRCCCIISYMANLHNTSDFLNCWQTIALFFLLLKKRHVALCLPCSRHPPIAHHECAWSFMWFRCHVRVANWLDRSLLPPFTG
jgi:hypothetical protein